MGAASSEIAGRQSPSRAERLALCHLPVGSSEDLAVYVEALRGFAAHDGAQLSPLAESPVHPIAWNPAGAVARLRTRLDAQAVPREEVLGPLTEEERYALFKLADPKRAPAKPPRGHGGDQ